MLVVGKQRNSGHNLLLTIIITELEFIFTGVFY